MTCYNPCFYGINFAMLSLSYNPCFYGINFAMPRSYNPCFYGINFAIIVGTPSYNPCFYGINFAILKKKCYNPCFYGINFAMGVEGATILVFMELTLQFEFNDNVLQSLFLWN
nr:hypothetical protein [Methanobrevibacter oralis]